MERALIVKGKITDRRRVDLDEAIDGMAGPVEITIRRLEPVGDSRRNGDVLDFIEHLPPGARTKEEIDLGIREERAGWRRNPS